MNFKFKNSAQANELISRLRVGQIIKIEVIEKSEHNIYLINFRGLVLSAVSELDLTSKSCWLKVTQLTPFPKMQIIIQEQNDFINDLFNFADENDLEIPMVPNQLKIQLSTISNRVNPRDLYEFLFIYTEWSTISNFMMNIKNCLISEDGITISDVNQFFNFCLLKKNDENDIKTSSKLLFSQNDNIDIDGINSILNILTKINKQIEKSETKLALLYTQHQKYTIIFPVECRSYGDNMEINGILKTKHFGKIIIKSEINKKIALSFENSIFMNAIKPICNKIVSVPIHLNIQNHAATTPNYAEVSFTA